MIKQLRVTSKDTGNSYYFYSVKQLATWLVNSRLDADQFTFSYLDKPDNWLNRLADYFRPLAGIPSASEKYLKRKEIESMACEKHLYVKADPVIHDRREFARLKQSKYRNTVLRPTRQFYWYVIEKLRASILKQKSEQPERFINREDWEPTEYLCFGGRSDELLKLCCEPLHGPMRQYIEPQHLKTINEQAHRDAGLI